MFVEKLILLFLLMSCLAPASAVDSKEILPVAEAFKFSVEAESESKLVVHFKIAPGYHLYREKFKFASQSETITLGQVDLPQGVLEKDEILGETVVYRGDIDIGVALQNQQHISTLSLLLKYQGCADFGVCYPPQKHLLEIALPEPVKSDNATQVKQLINNGFKSLAPDLFKQALLPPDQAFQFTASVKDSQTLHISWLPAEGYYLYKHKLSLSLDAADNVQLAAYNLPKGESREDPEFGQVEIYRQAVSQDVVLVRHSSSAQILHLTAKFQGCAERGVCYPPMQVHINLDLPAEDSLPAKQTNQLVSEQDRIVGVLKQDSLSLTLLSFFGFGLLLALTPCVFPMIPILSGIIVGHGANVGVRKGFFLSLSYVLASALMYTLFGVLAALFGGNLQATFQEPWVIALFSGLFVMLALSMFGFFTLELPKSLQAKAMHTSEKHRDGSYLGAALMGALSSLIVGPCVAAPLAAALIYIGQTGDVLLGGAALFMMGLGMGVPLLLLGLSAGKLLPKAGAWMNVTKSVFGVVMLAVALWMLSRILPAAVVMLLTAMLLIIPAVYLGAVEPLPLNATGLRTFCKAIGIVLLVLGILLLIGVSAGNQNILQPLQGIAAGQGVEPKQNLVFQKVRTLKQLDDLLLQAVAAHKPVMLDYYADWCVSCKELEAYTFTDAQVKRLLADFILVQADVTENDAEAQALLQRYGLIGPPGILFFNAEGQERTANRVIGFQDAEAFSRTLHGLQ